MQPSGSIVWHQTLVVWAETSTEADFSSSSDTEQECTAEKTNKNMLSADSALEMISSSAEPTQHVCRKMY